MTFGPGNRFNLSASWSRSDRADGESSLRNLSKENLSPDGNIGVAVLYHSIFANTVFPSQLYAPHSTPAHVSCLHLDGFALLVEVEQYEIGALTRH
jgi:hypothetical protein